MKIEFQDKELRKYAQDAGYARRKMGSGRAKKFHTRISSICAADSYKDLLAAPGRFHDLSENRRGQLSCHLDEPYRLIMEPLEPMDQIIDASGVYILSAIKGVKLIEITNYHKEK